MDGPVLYTSAEISAYRQLEPDLFRRCSAGRRVLGIGMAAPGLGAIAGPGAEVTAWQISPAHAVERLTGEASARWDMICLTGAVPCDPDEFAVLTAIMRRVARGPLLFPVAVPEPASRLIGVGLDAVEHVGGHRWWWMTAADATAQILIRSQCDERLRCSARLEIAPAALARGENVATLRLEAAGQPGLILSAPAGGTITWPWLVGHDWNVVRLRSSILPAAHGEDLRALSVSLSDFAVEGAGWQLSSDEAGRPDMPFWKAILDSLHANGMYRVELPINLGCGAPVRSQSSPMHGGSDGGIAQGVAERLTTAAVVWVLCDWFGDD